MKKVEKANIEKKFDYKWIVVAACFLMVFICLGFCNSTKSLFLPAITEALGIERTIYSFTESLRFISNSVVNIFFGVHIKRFGARKLIAAGFLSLIISMLLFATAPYIWLFYLGGIFLGIGLSWTTTAMVGYVVNKWCKKNCGTIMGAVLAASGLGGALSTQIVSPIINEDGNPFGYRNAYLLIAVILAVAGTVIVTVFRNSPKNKPMTEEVEEKKKKRGRDWSGISFSDAIKKTYFWLACVCVFFSGFVLQGVAGIVAAHMYDVGLEKDYVALILSFSWIVLAACKFFTGFVYDKLGLRITNSICTMATVLTAIALAFVTNSATGKILALTYPLFSSMAFPLETIMLPIYVKDFFGEKSFEKMLGIFVSINVAGYALGVPAVNLCYDLLGNYKVSLIISGSIGLLVFVLMQIIITLANKDHRRLSEQRSAESLTSESV